MSKLLFGLDVGDIAAMLSLLLDVRTNLKNTESGGKMEKVTQLLKSDVFKQQYSKMGNLGSTDEKEMLKIVFALLAGIDESYPLLLNKLLERMNDKEQEDFRGFITKIAAGGTADTDQDLRVKTLVGIVKVLKRRNGTSEALAMLRTMGLGKENQFLKSIKDGFKGFIDKYFEGNSLNLLAWLREHRDSLSDELKERADELEQLQGVRYSKSSDHPSILLWLLRLTQDGARKTPFSQVWEVHFVRMIIIFLWKCCKFIFTALRMLMRNLCARYQKWRNKEPRLEIERIEQLSRKES